MIRWGMLPAMWFEFCPIIYNKFYVSERILSHGLRCVENEDNVQPDIVVIPSHRKAELVHSTIAVGAWAELTIEPLYHFLTFARWLCRWSRWRNGCSSCRLCWRSSCCWNQICYLKFRFVLLPRAVVLAWTVVVGSAAVVAEMSIFDFFYLVCVLVHLEWSFCVELSSFAERVWSIQLNNYSWKFFNQIILSNTLHLPQ